MVSPRLRFTALAVASVAAGCTAIVGIDKNYELDPGYGHAGSAATGGQGGSTGGSAAGGAAGSGTGGSAGGAIIDGGNDVSSTGGSAGTAGRGGTSGSGGAAGASGTGGATGTGGASGSGGAAGTGGASGTGGSAGGTAGSGGSAGTAGSGGAGTAGSAGAAGATGTGGTAGSAGAAGASGSSVDAGDASTDGPPDASDGGGSDGAVDAPQDIPSPCGPGTKLCGVCVPTADPTYGCAGASCAPCEPNGTATCSGGNCLVTACNLGYHQVGNLCVVNGPEVCNNSIDDDGDTRIDCFDSDCAADVSCAGKCMDAATIACDAIVTGQDSGGAGSTSRISSYSCAPGTYAGSEYAYRFTGGSNQRVYAELYGLSGNLGLFEVGVPSGTPCTAGTSCGVYSDAVSTSGAEALGFTTQAGQDYYLVVDGPSAKNYSLSVQCSTFDGCWPTKPIEAGQSFSATNNPASGASNITSNKIAIYDCAGFSEVGPEAAWIFTPTVTANYEVRLDGLSTDCDLYILSGADCGATCLGPSTYSDNYNPPMGPLGTTYETVTFAAVANTTYYIVVDGYLGVTCNFTIGVTQL